jgi:hypothetical protein
MVRWCYREAPLEIQRTMAFRFFFRPPKNQRFDYVPRYYDPRKEELHERIRQIEHQQSDDPEAVKSRIASSFRKRNASEENARLRRKALRRSNLTLIAVLGGLLVLAYIFLSVYLPKILEFVEG